VKKFKITYRDPDTGELIELVEEFEDSPGIAAHEWADDYAYTLADKGWYKIEEMP
jgi:hypothetical protein